MHAPAALAQHLRERAVALMQDELLLLVLLLQAWMLPLLLRQVVALVGMLLVARLLQL